MIGQKKGKKQKHSHAQLQHLAREGSSRAASMAAPSAQPPPAQQFNEQQNVQAPPKSSTASSSGNVAVAKAKSQPKAIIVNV